MSETIREDLVEAAVAVFREKGYERATVREIADRAGMGVSALYFHIRSKEELCLAAVEPVLETGAAWMEELAGDALPPLDKLRRAIRRSIEIYGAHPEVVIYLQDFFPVVERLRPDLSSRTKLAWTEIVRQVLAEEGREDELDPKLVAYGILGMFSWMHRWYRPEGQAGAAEIGDLYASLLIDGLRARSGQPSRRGNGSQRERST